ncbi:hypothetical protein J6590_075568 [Homalodisca vitripennis]|nr:hypothetical protein J6590_075568 [Homalodisca vitripennis]
MAAARTSQSRSLNRAEIAHIRRRTHTKRRGTVQPGTSSTVVVVSVAARQRMQRTVALQLFHNRNCEKEAVLSSGKLA